MLCNKWKPDRLRITKSLLVITTAALICLKATADITFEEHITPILQNHCLLCHSESGISFSFENPETAYKFGPAMVSAVEERRMPPWLAEPSHIQYEDDYSLNKEEIRTFTQWGENNYARNNALIKVKNILSYTAQNSTFKSDKELIVNNGNSYLPNQNKKDDYHCFLMEWPEKEKTYITGLRAIPGNAKVIHHLILFTATPEIAPHLRKMESEEEGSGYECFGGGAPDRLGNPSVRAALEKLEDGLSRKINSGIHFLSHWAPGMNGIQFPKDTGIPIEPGALIIAQMHYYSAFAPGESDKNSAMHFITKKEVKKPGFFVTITNRKWLNSKGNKTMVIPSKQEASYSITENFRKIQRRVLSILKIKSKEIKNLELHSANIHMHSYGKAGKVFLDDPLGNRERLLTINNWDLNWQRNFTFHKPKVLPEKDLKDYKISIECEYTNPWEYPIYGGFGSNDEMCINFSFIAVDKKIKKTL